MLMLFQKGDCDKPKTVLRNATGVHLYYFEVLEWLVIFYLQAAALLLPGLWVARTPWRTSSPGSATSTKVTTPGLYIFIIEKINRSFMQYSDLT